MAFFGGALRAGRAAHGRDSRELLPGRPELIPIPFAAILVTMLYNGRIGVFAALTLAILLDGQWALRETHILFFGLVGGVAGAIGIRVVRRRRHLYVTIGVVAGGERAGLDHRRPDAGLVHRSRSWRAPARRR